MQKNKGKIWEKCKISLAALIGWHRDLGNFRKLRVRHQNCLFFVFTEE